MLQHLKCGFYEEPCPWEETMLLKAVADALGIPIAIRRAEFESSRLAVDDREPRHGHRSAEWRGWRGKRMKIVNHNNPDWRLGREYSAVRVSDSEHRRDDGVPVPQQGSWQSPQFVIRNGVVKVPAGPGLGLEIAPKFLATAGG